MLADLRRAWTLAGLAIRHALTLGLHVRSTATSLSDADKEHRVRSWWSLYSLECTLNELTGRPTCIADRDISTPLPINVEEADFRADPILYDRMEGVQSDPLSPSTASHSRSSHCKFNILQRNLSDRYSQPCCHLPNAIWFYTTYCPRISSRATPNDLLNIFYLSNATIHRIS